VQNVKIKKMLYNSCKMPCYMVLYSQGKQNKANPKEAGGEYLDNRI
jgi:hypothetical protein